MFGLGMPEIIVLLVIVVLVFGAGRISELGGAIGKGIKNFKKSINGPDEIDISEPRMRRGRKKDVLPQPVRTMICLDLVWRMVGSPCRYS